MKKIIALSLSVIMFFASSAFSFSEDKKKNLEEQKYNLELRSVKEAKKISDGLSEKIDDALVLFVGSPNAYVFGKIDRVDLIGGLNSFKNGDQVNFSSDEVGLAPVVINNRTLIPLRFVSQSLGAEVLWTEETNTATILLEDNQVVFTSDSTLYYVNGEQKNLDTVPQLIKNRMFIPLRALAEALSYNVFWDESGLIAISKEKCFEKESDAALIEELEQSFYNYTSADVQHPFKYRFIEMIGYSDRDNLRKFTLDELKTKLGSAYTMEEGEYISEIKAELAKQKFLDTPSSTVRSNTHRLAACYIKTGDDFYARRSILTMYQQAINYKNVPKELSTRYASHLQELFGQMYFIPDVCVNAYDILYYSDQWNVLSRELGTDVRKTVEDWFRECVTDALDFFGGNYIQNTNGSCVPPAIFTAMIINDAPLLHKTLYEFEDLLFSGYEFHADGMWMEGTYSYLSDTIGKHQEMLPLFVYYKDPIGYKDDKYNFSLNYESGYVTFPFAKKVSQTLSNRFLPNGLPIALQDTYPTHNKNPNKEIKEKYLKNLELNHFGYYTLTHGDTQDAQQVHLSFLPLAEGGPYSSGVHYHYANLPILLWGGGMEVLPEMGYITPTTLVQDHFVRYPNFHNASFIWTKGENYWAQRSMRVKTATLAYDGGDNNGKKVQLIEASSVGTDHPNNKIDTKRRLLLMIETEGNSSYTFDLQRLKGGDAHEDFLISGEDERTELETTLEMTEHEGTLKELLKNDDAGYPSGREYITSPKTASGENDFDFKWTGKESGTSLHIYMNGIKGNELFFSSYPSYRETMGNKSSEYDYPGWHFYRRSKVNSNDTTRYGAIYETSKKGQSEKVKAVKWIEPTSQDPMCIAAVVDLGENEDIIYISNDTKERTAYGITFAGNIAVLRRNKNTKKHVWSYIYGEGKIKADGVETLGKETKRFKVIDAHGDFTENAENYLKIKGVLSNGNYNNVWLKVKFPDQTGWALKIKKADQSYIYTEQHPAFEVTGTGSKMLFHPRIEFEYEGYTRVKVTDMLGYTIKDLRNQKQRKYEGDTWVEVSVPTFVYK